MIFSTLEDLVISPPKLFAAKTGRATDDQLFTDAWDDLRFEGSEVVCFASEPITPGDAVYFGFEDSLGGTVLRLTIKASIEGIGVDPTGSADHLGGVERRAVALRPRSSSDTTGGLNRDGQIVLLMPRDMEPLSLGGTRAFWLRARLLAVRPGQPPYQASPRIAALSVDTLGGTVAAEHATVVGAEVLGRSDGSPGQFLALTRSPVLPRAGR